MRIHRATPNPKTLDSACKAPAAASPSCPAAQVERAGPRVREADEPSMLKTPRQSLAHLLAPPPAAAGRRAQPVPADHLLHRLVVTPASIKVSGLIGLQQMAVGASNIFLVCAQAALMTGAPGVALYAGLFLASLMVPYVPGAAAMYYTEKWKHEAALRISEATIQGHAGQVSRLVDDAVMRRASAHVASEGRKIAATAIDGWAELLGLALNVVTNLSVLSYLLSPAFGIAYALGGAAAGFIVWKTAPSQQDAARSDHDADLRLAETGGSFAQNVIIGNAGCWQRWQHSHRARLQAWSEAALRSLRRGRAISLAATFVTALPILAVVAMQLAFSAQNPPALGALLVSLPRLVITMSYVEGAISAAIGNITSLARLREVCRRCTLEADEGWASRIDLDALSLTQDGRPAGLLEIAKGEASRQPGHWLLEGPNGKGKSTLLLALKAHWGAEAFYLPAHPKILLGKNEGAPLGEQDDLDGNQAGSTGQVMMRALCALTHLPEDVKVLLLDEPDSNLDTENQAKARTLIAALATTKSVIEVRHSREKTVTGPRRS